MILTINGQQAALKKGSSIEYVSENRIFTDADDYSMDMDIPFDKSPETKRICSVLGNNHYLCAINNINLY